MSYEYRNFASLPVNLNRQAYGSLDISQVFTSQADLDYYISKGAVTENVSEYWLDTVPYPYAGQYLALVNNDTREVTAYILSEKEDGTFECKEVGVTPVGDDNTVVVGADGKISLYGVAGLDGAKTYVPKIKNGKLVWEEPSSLTVEGLDVSIKSLQTDVGNLQAKDTELNAAIEGVASDVEDHETRISNLETADGEQDELIESQGKKISNLELTVNGTTLEQGLVHKVESLQSDMTQAKADITNRYTKSETNEYVAAEIAKMAHFSSKVVTSVDQMDDPTTLYLMKKDGVTGADVYEQYVVLDGNPTLIGETSVDLKDYAKTSEVESEVQSVKTELDAAYKAADKALGERIDGVESTISELDGKYATDEDVSKKADQADLNKTNETVETHTTKISELEAVKHSHSNATVLNGITADKVAKWDAAEANLVKSVKSGELEVSASGELAITAVPQAKVTGLGTKLTEIDAKVTGKVDKKDGYDLISAADLAKLTNLSAAGTLDASKIDNLGGWISDNRETVAGLMSADEETKLAGIASGAQVNVIEGVKVAGSALSPDANKIVDVPFATNLAYGVVKGHEGENTVMINSSNQMEVHSLNVSKLVQDENTVLILNGGNA